MDSMALVGDFTRLVQNPKSGAVENAYAILETVCRRLRLSTGFFVRRNGGEIRWLEEYPSSALDGPEREQVIEWLQDYHPKGHRAVVHDDQFPAVCEASCLICIPLFIAEEHLQTEHHPIEQNPIGCFGFFQTEEERTWSPLAEHVIGIMTAWFVQRLQAETKSNFSLLPSAETEAWPGTGYAELLLSTTQQQLLITDTNGRIQAMNRAALKFEDLAPERAGEYMLWTLPSVAHLEGGADAIRESLKEVRQYRSFHSERIYRYGQGTRIFKVTTRQVSHPLSADPLFVIEAVESTEMVNSASLADLNQTLVRAAFDMSSHFMGLLTPDGRAVFANQTALHAVNLTNHDIRDKPFWALPWFLAADEPRLRHAVLEASQGSTVRFEMAIRAVGRMIPIEFSLKPIRNAKGHIDYLMPEGKDLSAQKVGVQGRMESERTVHQHVREQSLSSLAAGVAHNFNNLLTSIMGTFELIEPRDDMEASLLRNGIEATRRATRLSAAMLAFSGHGSVRKEDVDLSALLLEQLMDLRDIVDDYTSLRIDAMPNPPLIQADPRHLKLAIQSLVENADEAMADRGGEISIRTFLPENKAGMVSIEVRDDGQGMDEKVVEHAFEPFFSTRMVGRGLGLAAVKGVVTGHGGTISIRSEPAKGTTVRIDFPTRHPSLPPKPKDTRPTVLIVDDDPLFRQSTACSLETCGYRSLQARDGFEALAINTRITVDAILLDLQMPGIDGMETLRHLQRCKTWPPVVLIQELANPIDIDFANQSVATVLTKPITPSALKDLLSTLIPDPTTPNE